MNAAHVHLALNHVPVLGCVFGLALLLAGLLRGQRVLLQAALGTFVVAALVAVPVFLSGHPAEEFVENAPDAAMSVAAAHEDAATFAVTALAVLGVAALFALVRTRGGNALGRPMVGLVLVLALTSSSLMLWTALLGGQVRHAEIREGGARPHAR